MMTGDGQNDLVSAGMRPAWGILVVTGGNSLWRWLSKQLGYMFPQASYKMVNKQTRGERDSLICLGKDYLGAADPGEREILTWVCPQGVPRVNDRAHSLWSPS